LRWLWPVSRCQFYQHLKSSFFVWKCFCSAFLYLQFGFVTFWQKNIGTKAALKKVGWNWLQGSCVVKFFTSFTKDIFAMFIASIYIAEAIHNTIEVKLMLMLLLSLLWGRMDPQKDGAPSTEVAKVRPFYLFLWPLNLIAIWKKHCKNQINAKIFKNCLILHSITMKNDHKGNKWAKFFLLCRIFYYEACTKKRLFKFGPWEKSLPTPYLVCPEKTNSLKKQWKLCVHMYN